MILWIAAVAVVLFVFMLWHVPIRGNKWLHQPPYDDGRPLGVHEKIMSVAMHDLDGRLFLVGSWLISGPPLPFDLARQALALIMEKNPILCMGLSKDEDGIPSEFFRIANPEVPLFEAPSGAEWRVELHRQLNDRTVPKSMVSGLQWRITLLGRQHDPQYNSAMILAANHSIIDGRGGGVLAHEFLTACSMLSRGVSLDQVREAIPYHPMAPPMDAYVNKVPVRVGTFIKLFYRYGQIMNLPHLFPHAVDKVTANFTEVQIRPVCLSAGETTAFIQVIQLCAVIC